MVVSVMTNGVFVLSGEMETLGTLKLAITID
jgi:hypothetical protein